jgi:5'-methylthioadenosine phosphorylase
LTYFISEEVMSKIAVIGGSGVYQLEGMKLLKRHKITTPYGSPSNEIIEASIDGTQCFFLPRHGEGHHLLPHEVNYRANIFALKLLGVEYVISVSAVGSLKEELEPTHFVLVDQFIDWTRGRREKTFFGNGAIAHISNANPVNALLQEFLANACSEEQLAFTKGGSYICIEGPGFSTRAESAMYRSFGASVIGMTNVPEAYLAKEAGMAYATVAMVTDYDCWKDEHCTVDEIMKVMKTNNMNAQKLLKNVLPKISSHPFTFEKENKIGMMSDISKLDEEQRKAITVLLT